MAKLLLDRITKTFGKVTAVDNLSLEVSDGEFLVLLGPSGAGKTTTLKVIAGVETPTRGLVSIGDRVVNALEPQRRNVAMAYETYALYPHLNVGENLAFPLRAPGRNLGKAQIEQRVKEVATLLNIHMLLDRLPGELSGGQRQRVSLGRAMVRNPDVMLLDEPISHLDAKLRHRMRAEFKALKSAIKTTTVYVTHDYLEAMSLADRVATLDHGRLQQIGTPDDIFVHPVNVFVATLLGHPKINLVRCRVVTEAGRMQLVSADGAVRLTAPDSIRLKVEQANVGEVIVGIRPFDVYALDHQPEQGDVLGGTVYVYERLGTQGVLTASVGATNLDVLTSLEDQFDIDAPVKLAVKTDQVMVFDPATEHNILLD
jgi:multiple sugar transport system ATP-binding protein